MSKRDYYEVLGIQRDAGDDDIKKAYRKQAMQYHPDKNPGDKNAEDKFKEIGEAYAVLSDKNKRARFDRYGHAGAQSGNGFGGFNFEGEGFDPMDLFHSFFDNFGGGGFGGFGDGRGQGRRQRNVRRGSDLNIKLKLTLEEIATGIEKKVKIKYQAPCSECNASGSKDGKTDPCTQCGGSGQVRQVSNSIFGQFVNVTTCPNCRGEGVIISTPCSSCNGTGLERNEKTVAIHVPAGVSEGQYLKMQGLGNHGARSGEPGDIIVEFHEKSHEHFTRHDDDVLYELTITYTQAVLGSSVEVPTLTGRVKLNIPAGTNSGKVLRLKGKGIQHLNHVGSGDQLVRISILVPRKVNAKATELLEALEEELKGSSEDKSFFKKVFSGK